MQCSMCGEENDQGRWVYDLWVCQVCLDGAKARRIQPSPKADIMGFGENRPGRPPGAQARL